MGGEVGKEDGRKMENGRGMVDDGKWKMKAAMHARRKGDVGGNIYGQRNIFEFLASLLQNMITFFIYFNRLYKIPNFGQKNKRKNRKKRKKRKKEDQTSRKEREKSETRQKEWSKFE